MDNKKFNRIIRQTLNEEVSKSEVKDIFKDELKSRDFEKKVREIVADCISALHKEMYFRDSLWKTAIKN